MIKIDVVIPQNDVEAISEALKKIHVGGITILKAKGRGKTIAPKIHASKGTEMFTPEFSDRYTVQVIVEDEKENEAYGKSKRHIRYTTACGWLPCGFADSASGQSASGRRLRGQ